MFVTIGSYVGIFFLCLWAADFLTGIVHWAEDTYCKSGYPTHRQPDLRAQQATPRRSEPDGANGQFLVEKLHPMVGLQRGLRVFVANRFWLFPGIPDVAVGVLWQ